MSRSYNTLSMTRTHVEVTGGILVGSLTTTPIKVGSVTVKEYEAGFNEAGNDFKEISFD